VKRDIIERGRNVSGVLQQYEKFVKPAYDDYIYPVSTFSFYPPFVLVLIIRQNVLLMSLFHVD
jgi:hypothetical protein